MRKPRGFTLIEMLVVILVIVILIGIGLAVGEQVKSSSEMALTKSELKGLQGALEWYEHKTAGQVPTDMLSFLEGYQRLHAYQITGTNNWAQHKNFLTNLPASAVVTGAFPAPGNTGAMLTGVVEILDGLGNPIQYVPAADSLVNAATAPDIKNYTYPYPQLAGGVYSSSPYGVSSIKGQLVYVPALTNADLPPVSSEMPLPSQVHAPCFFSFGTNYNSTNPSAMNYESYTYSYNP
ncbi:MAG: prepilin-type N-terminal cleavage/methylation domain-containing protein [Phycisphaerae bacterium]